MPRGGKRPGSGKKKGSKHAKTLLWEQFGKILLTEGVHKAKTELMKLRGVQFLTLYEKYLSYFQPRTPQTFDLNIVSNEHRRFIDLTAEEKLKYIEKLKADGTERSERRGKG